MSDHSPAAEPWWKSAVLYQVYPRSFCDASGDGVGDLAGVRRQVDHLRWLGIDAVWLSPVYRSPMADHGYDISDHCDIDPLFGTLADLDGLVEDLHGAGIRLLMDWVPNHTSDQHPWFVESRADRDSPKRDWYVWRDGRPPDPATTPPNNWQAAFPPGPAWTRDEASGQWYLHLFTPEQPDLDWSNPAVRAAMLDVLRFWLDRGVDGFRMDVIHAIGKDPTFADVSPELAGLPSSALNDRPETHPHLRQIRAVLDSYDGDRVSLGEVYLLDTERVATYYGDGDELHLCCNFPPMWAPWDARPFRRQIEIAEEHLAGPHRWPTWSLGNHDHVRLRTRFGGREGAARAAAVLLLTLRGTPIVYGGDELGLEDAVVPPEMVQDPAGRRDGCRAPIPWEESPPHGWASADTWLPFPPDAGRRSAGVLRSGEDTILHLHRRLIAARRESPALTLGDLELLDPFDGAPGVLGWRRHHGSGDERLVLVNFRAEPAVAPAPGRWRVEVATGATRQGSDFDGHLAADEAVVLARR